MGDVKACRKRMRPFTLENGGQIPLQGPEEVLVCVRVSGIQGNPSEELKQEHPIEEYSEFPLPISFLRGKNKGDLITLKLDETLIDFTLPENVENDLTNREIECYRENRASYFPKCGELRGFQAREMAIQKGRNDLSEITLNKKFSFALGEKGQLEEIPHKDITLPTTLERPQAGWMGEPAGYIR